MRLRIKKFSIKIFILSTVCVLCWRGADDDDDVAGKAKGKKSNTKNEMRWELKYVKKGFIHLFFYVFFPHFFMPYVIHNINNHQHTVNVQ
jgi:hypothetical protein